MSESEAERDAQEVKYFINQSKFMLANMVHTQKYELGLTHKEIERLSSRVEAFEKASQKFVDKVESGRARSKETYSDLKALLDNKQSQSAEGE